MKEVVLFGGASVEHDISIITAIQAIRAIGREVLPIYIDKKGIWWTADNLQDLKTYENFEKYAKNKKQLTLVLGTNQLLQQKHNKFVEFERIACIINCCHGRIGEDGAVQGLCKVCDIAQTSSSPTTMSLCMDKTFMKDILKANNIASPEYVYFDICEFQQNKIQKKVTKIGFPLVVKPANLGSSIGISVCRNEKELSKALNLAFKFDKKVLIEKLVENLREFNCACFYYKSQFFTSSVVEVKNKKEIYTFEDKYLTENSKTCEADKKLTKKVQIMTEKIYKLFCCQGVVRVDFLFDAKKEILYVNEINAIPGSLSFYLFKGVPFKELLNAFIMQAKLNQTEERKLITTFDSEALKIFGSVGETPKK
ncbi:MAG: ATP-grasp domain-containing protein [Candidatus Caccovivens sp.]